MSEVGLFRLNRMALPEALRTFGKCCGSSAWCFKMASGRPYPSRSEILRFSDLKFMSLTRREWLEAFAHHPRIGDLKGLEESDKTGWSSEEQASALAAPPELLDQLAEANSAYEKRFGFPFIIHATGLEAGEILGQMRRRMNHDSYDEQVISGEHLAKITRIRLDKLLDELADDLTEADLEAWSNEHGGAKPARRQPAPGSVDESREPEYLKARGRAPEAKSDTKKSA